MKNICKMEFKKTEVFLIYSDLCLDVNAYTF